MLVVFVCVRLGVGGGVQLTLFPHSVSDYVLSMCMLACLFACAFVCVFACICAYMFIWLYLCVLCLCKDYTCQFCKWCHISVFLRSVYVWVCFIRSFLVLLFSSMQRLHDLISRHFIYHELFPLPSFTFFSTDVWGERERV